MSSEQAKLELVDLLIIAVLRLRLVGIEIIEVPGSWVSKR